MSSQLSSLVSPTNSPKPTSSSTGSSPSPSLKTTIIISNLSKDDFVSDSSSMVARNLSFADQIKLTTLNLATPEDTSYRGDEYYLNSIEYWSNLPSLNRIIIILKTEEAASNLFNHLTTHQEDLKFSEKNIKISLQENLLVRSKSFDSFINLPNNSLTVSARNLSSFKNFYNGDADEYIEPEPRHFNVIEDLSKIGIDVVDYNTDEQLNELKDPSSMKRSRSLTKTLFKPNLKLNINQEGANDRANTQKNIPPSPTITLDEAF